MICKLFAYQGIRHVFSVFAFMGVAMVLPEKSMAQQDTIAPLNLKEVEIIQSKKNKIFKSSASVQILQNIDLERLNSLSVADALRYFSGVQLKDYGGVGGLKTINVRSMGSNHTAVFYDGIQLGNAQNGQVDLGKFSLENLEELALYSGQNDELLQPAKAFASASSLYLKSSSPVFLSRKTNLKAGLKTGSFGLVNPTFSIEQKLSAKLSASFDSEFIQADGRYKFRYTNGHYDTTVVRSNADIQALRLEAALHGETQSFAKWNVKLYKYQSERGIPGAIVSNKFDFSQRQWDDHVFIQAKYQNSLNKRYNYLINVKYANDYLRYLDPDRKTAKGPLDNTYKQQEWYFSMANVYHLKSYLDFSFSADYSLQTLDANLYKFSYPTRQTGLLAFASKFYTKRFDLQGNLLATFIDDRVKMNTSAGRKAEFTPIVLFSAQPFNSPNFRVKGFYKSIFRMPTFNDLYYTFVGNTLLEPEYTQQFDIGFNYQWKPTFKVLKHLSVQVDAYYNKVKNKIVAVPTANLFRWTMLNLDAVDIKGLEINLKSNWLLNVLDINTSLNYTFEQAIDATPTGYTYGHQIPYIPKHSGSFTTGLTYKSIGLNYSFLYTGARYSQKANLLVNYIEPYYTHDIAINKSFGHKVKYKVALEINNLLNQYYDVVLNYPMPGRNFRINIKAKI